MTGGALVKKLLIGTLTALALLTVGCAHRYVVRDHDVYQAELNQYDSWATNQAALLRGFVTANCTCTEAALFADKKCAESADWILTVEARHDWHKAMSLYNAGITEERPPKDPPEIPASSCPLPAAPAASGGE
jgi:hypothetical protein